MKNIVAAFDFDNTLTRCDTFLPFLCFCFGRWFVWLRLPLLFPQCVRYLIARNRQQMKEAALTLFFKDTPIEEITQKANAFAQKCLPSLLKKEGMEHFLSHRSQGHRCVIVSASLRLYIEPWALAQGFDQVIASELEVNSSQQLTGHLQGKNCRAQEKVSRLQQVLGRGDHYIYAYGDSDGDRELLAWADKGQWVR